MFYDLRHQSIFELLAEMYDQKEAIDLITVQQRLKDKNQLEAVAAWLSGFAAGRRAARRRTWSTTWTSSGRSSSCGR